MVGDRAQVLAEKMGQQSTSTYFVGLRGEGGTMLHGQQTQLGFGWIRVKVFVKFLKIGHRLWKNRRSTSRRQDAQCFGLPAAANG